MEWMFAGIIFAAAVYCAVLIVNFARVASRVRSRFVRKEEQARALAAAVAAETELRDEVRARLDGLRTEVHALRRRVRGQSAYRRLQRLEAQYLAMRTMSRQ